MNQTKEVTSLAMQVGRCTKQHNGVKWGPIVLFGFVCRLFENMAKYKNSLRFVQTNIYDKT